MDSQTDNELREYLNSISDEEWFDRAKAALVYCKENHLIQKDDSSKDPETLAQIMLIRQWLHQRL